MSGFYKESIVLYLKEFSVRNRTEGSSCKMAFLLFSQLIVLLAALAVISNAFSPKFHTLKSRSSNGISYSGRLALQMGSHGIYDVKSDNGVHSISFEVRQTKASWVFPAID